MVTVERVRTAHADAWEAEGRARAAYGGGAARVRGARLMASGLPAAKWNNADVTGADLDVGAVRRWYAERAVPWGLRVPVELSVELGRPLFVKRCFGLRRTGFRPASRPPELLLRQAGGSEGGWFAAAEATAFGDPVEVAEAWVGPVFGRRGFEHWVARGDGEVAAVATAVWSHGAAGPAVMLTGLAAVAGTTPAALPALATVVLERAFAAAPQALAHSHAEPGEDVTWLVRLGFSEVPGLLVRVVEERA
jgi:hypothetical protein